MKIIVITPFEKNSWEWFGAKTFDHEWQFKNLNLFKIKSWLWPIYIFLLLPKLAKADLVVSHYARVSLIVSILMKLLGIKTPHLAYSFNHGDGLFFSGIYQHLATWSFRSVWGVVVYSESERLIYSKYYNIPIEKFSFTHWAVKNPELDEDWWADKNIIGDYICSLGRNNRDWKLLLEVASKMNEKFVIVCVKNALEGLVIPSNVIVFYDITSAQSASLIKWAKLNIVPILDDTRGTGHMTIVNSMKLGIPLVIANNSTIIDYFIEGEHGYAYSVADATSLRLALDIALQNTVRIEILSNNCKEFAIRWFSEESSQASLKALLDAVLRRDALPPPSPPGWIK
jgi:glycosyltransferase involved in cell wall biosynthesis